MTEKTTCFSMVQDARIDRAEGIIYGVAVITEGEAKGHGIKIDHKSLETVRTVASEFPNGVKVKLKHREEGEFQSVVDQVCGVIKNFSIKDNKTIGNFHLLKSLDEKTKAKIYDMAEVMPDQFGFSIVFSGPSETKDGVKYLRCQEIQSIDLADKPAANPDGLFEEKFMSEKIKYKSGESGEHHSECMCASCKESKMEADKKKGEKKMEELQTAVDKLTELVTKLSEKPATVTSLSYKNEKGEVVQLSGEQIATALSNSSKIAADAEKVLRGNIIDQMGREGRVAKNPATKIAYKLEELQALPMDTLQLLALNSPCIPLEAKAVYKGGEKKSAASDPNLKGSDKVIASLGEKYNDLETMLATPMGQTVSN